MDFAFSEDQDLIIEAIKDFSKKKLNDNIFKDDEGSIFPIQKWRDCGAMGIIGLPVPKEYGGEGRDLLTTSNGIKALSFGCCDEGLIFSICAHICTFIIPIIQHGTDEQKITYLPKAASGELIGGNGISEAGAGSDISLMKTSVIRNSSGYKMNGSKIFVTNGSYADALIIYGKHPNGIRMADISAFIITKDNFSIGQTFQKMGLRTSTLCEILLTDCCLTEKDLLGRECFGANTFNISMFWERIIMSAYHIGAMERQYNVVLDYSNKRSQFGHSIRKFQSITDRLIEMKTKIELSNLMLNKASWNYDNQKIDMSEASMLKLFVSDARISNSLNAVQIYGAYGYLKESIVEKDLRDSIAATMYSGTSEIQKKIISENIGDFYE